MILLDTHTWIWLVTKSSNLSRTAKKSIDQEASIGVSAISCWEVASLAKKKRLEFDRPIEAWIHQALAEPKIASLAIDPEIAVIAGLLDIHGDPADRLIVATAMRYRCPIVTKDQKIRALGGVKTVW